MKKILIIAALPALNVAVVLAQTEAGTTTVNNIIYTAYFDGTAMSSTWRDETMQ